MKLLDELRSLLDAPAAALKAAEVLQIAMTGRTLPDKDKPKDKPNG